MSDGEAINLGRKAWSFQQDGASAFLLQMPIELRYDVDEYDGQYDGWYHFRAIHLENEHLVLVRNSQPVLKTTRLAQIGCANMQR